MRAMRVLVQAVVGAVFGAILLVFLWLFLGPQSLGIPRAALPWGLLAGAALGALCGAVAAWYSLAVYERRLTENQQYATRLNVRFEEEPAEMDWPKSLSAGVQHGERGAWRHHWQGEYAGLPLEVADVRYTVQTNGGEGGSSSRTYEHTVYAWNVNQFPLPSVSITGRGWGAAVVTVLLGGERIVGFEAGDLPEQRAQIVREFNRRFIVAASPQNDGEAAVRRLCVPDVMQALLNLGNIRLLAAQGRIACWWPNVVSSGAGRQQRIEQTHRLLKILVGASEDKSAELVPPNPHARSDALWSVLPLGCAFGTGILGFFAGGITAAVFGYAAFRRDGDSPQLLYVVLPVGMLLLFAVIGWVAGSLVVRCRGRR